jgi:hypothetical protein
MKIYKNKSLVLIWYGEKVCTKIVSDDPKNF